jgi:hypothetical protein
MASLDTLISFIEKNYPFTEISHTALAGATDEEKKVFAIRHLALHFGKTAGKVLAVLEDYDHTKNLDTASLKEDVPKALINTLRLAKLIGMTEDDIVEDIEGKYKSKIN